MMEMLGTLRGPEFLILFFGWFVVTRLGVGLCRSAGWDSPLVTLGGIALFEALGVLRFLAEIEHGMHRWGFLAAMMVLGPIFFAVRGEGSSGGGGFWDSGSPGGGGFWGGSSSSSSCGSSSCGGDSGGGSSCGGGGCGGCGGS